jgi:hypothetical protein
MQQFNNLNEKSMYLIIGQKRSGKTTAAKYLCNFIKANKFVVYTSASEGWVDHNVNTEVLNISKIEEKLLEIQGKQNKNERMCLVFDDFDSELIMKSNSPMLIKELFINHRHYNLDIVFVCNYFNQILQSCIDQIDYYLLLKMKNAKNYKFENLRKGDFIWMDDSSFETKFSLGKIPFDYTKQKQKHEFETNNTFKIELTRLENGTKKLCIEF